MLAPWLEREHPLTKAVIGAIPADKADYRPDHVARSAIDLAWHIVSAEIRFINGCAQGAFDYDATRPEAVRTPSEIIDWYADRFVAGMNRVNEASGEQLLTPIDFRGIFTMPALVYLQTAAQHSIHHRGQLSMYLRPMGAKVPSIYGESFDARQARETAISSR